MFAMVPFEHVCSSGTCTSTCGCSTDPVAIRMSNCIVRLYLIRGRMRIQRENERLGGDRALTVVVCGIHRKLIGCLRLATKGFSISRSALLVWCDFVRSDSWKDIRVRIVFIVMILCWLLSRRARIVCVIVMTGQE